jgi:hypothetical protein
MPRVLKHDSLDRSAVRPFLFIVKEAGRLDLSPDVYEISMGFMDGD